MYASCTNDLLESMSSGVCRDLDAAKTAAIFHFPLYNALYIIFLTRLLPRRIFCEATHASEAPQSAPLYEEDGMTMPQRIRQYLHVLVATLAMLFATVTADAAIHYVTPEGAGNKDGTRWEDAYDEATFPVAIASPDTVAGDEFWVKKGVYRPVIPANPDNITEDEENKSFVLKDGVALYGGFDGTKASSADRDPARNLTVLTGDLENNDTNKAGGVTVSADQIKGTNSICVVSTDSGCGPTTVLDGFTVTAGDNDNDGGGMVNHTSSPTVTNCVFSGNRAHYGGGMYNSSFSNPTVTNCTFSGNSAIGYLSHAGGMLNDHSSPTVTDCVFSGNNAEQTGGGMCNFNVSSPDVTDCAFSGNSSKYGGGMYNEDSSSTVTNCTFSGNKASNQGGGMHNYDKSTPTVTNCTFSGNTANNGGGMYNYDKSNSIVTNCTFSGNSAQSDGGGVFNHNSSPTVTNCTFSGNKAPNQGGGMYNYNCGGDPVVTNCIFWGDTGGEILSDLYSSPDVTYCVVQGGYTGTGNLDGDPLLGPLADNGGPTKTHALTFGSSAIDKGATIETISCDQRGVARPQGAKFDIGAYESWVQKILTVNTIGSGFVTCDPSGDVVGATGKCWSYDNGTPVTLSADDGVHGFFSTWSGDASGATTKATVTMSCDRYVEAIFDTAWIIAASAGANGSIDPSGGVKVHNGETRTFNVTPDANYMISEVCVDGISVDAATTYTFTDVSADHTITVSFDLERRITATAGAHGAIAPSGVVSVVNGSDMVFDMIPDAGYAVADVAVDGASVGAVSRYVFGNITADHAISVSFDLAPTPTPNATPTTAPAPTVTPTVTPSATPTPVPTPDPQIPLPKVTLKITLYAGGTVVAGPIDITDPATLDSLLSSPALLAQLLATDPAAILSGNYNMELVRFFSLVADLDDGILDFTILFEVTVEGVPAGYQAQLFMLTRTFDSKGNPTGYAIVPRDEGSTVFRKGSGARGWTETWRVTVRDGSAGDGDGKQNGSVAPQIAAVVAVFPTTTPTVTVTPTQGITGSGGGCSLPAMPGAALATLLLLAPVALMRRR
jgi:parallel beta-helix repeat protein